MREYCTYGSARGAIGNCRPYRNFTSSKGERAGGLK
jgi:hypothetical protein